MRSCEFSEATGERKTKIITIGGIRFFTKDNVTIPQSNREMFRAYGISITFVLQKKTNTNGMLFRKNILLIGN